MKLGLILSNDWELFGDGTGDYFIDQHKPLLELHNAALNQGAKITVMAEVAQQFAHAKLKSTWAQEICKAWEELLGKLIFEGSDVQLHFHPQWLDAKYKHGTWELNFNKWSISSLADKEMLKALLDGKRYLEKILKPHNSNYECIGFRAGAFCAQPSKILIRNLKVAGFLCDSSVIKGLIHKGYYDYSAAYSRYKPWHTMSDNLNKRGNQGEGVIEFPIASCRVIDAFLLRKLYMGDLLDFMNFGVKGEKIDYTWLSENQRIIDKRYSQPKKLFNKNDEKVKNLYERINQISTKLYACKSVILDYDKLPPVVFVKLLEKIYDEEARLNDQEVTIPVMAIGHTKLMHNVDNFERTLDLIKRKINNKVTIITLKEAADYWNSMRNKH